MYSYVGMYVNIDMYIYGERERERHSERERERDHHGGYCESATISRLLEIIGLFCKRAL